MTDMRPTVTRLAAALLLTACGSGTTGATASGGGLYAGQCGVCHGPAGEGTVTGPPVVGFDEATIRTAVVAGVDPATFNGMAPVPRLDETDVAAIARHVATFGE